MIPEKKKRKSKLTERMNRTLLSQVWSGVVGLFPKNCITGYR